jgi:DNA modification methylase
MGAQIDRAEELQSVWQVQRGDVWVIGKHRLLCGDSTNADDVARVMDGQKAQLVVTDPPYGVDYDPEWRDNLSWQENGTAAGETIANDDNMDWLAAFQHLPADVVYSWISTASLLQLQIKLSENGFQLRNHIIWNKDLAPISRGHYHWKHEPCLYMVKKGCDAKWAGDRTQKTVWDIPTIHSFANGHNKDEWGILGHGNQKPIECMATPIRNHDAAIVYDPFLGSGTTLVACEQLGRSGRGIEIEPKYCAVILQRMTDMGLTPIKAD